MIRTLITGGSGGLGSAICQQLSHEPYVVEAPTRNELDLSMPNAIKTALSGSQYDLLVYCAGIANDALMAKLSHQEWLHHWQVNCDAAYQCAMAVWPYMKQQSSGHIIFISSFSAIHPPIGQTAYAASKAGLMGLTQSLAQLGGSDGIRVNAILPGFMETRMTAQLSPTRKQQVQNDHCLPAFNTCHHVAKFVQFLHENLPHTSGQSFQLDSRIP